MMAMAMNAPPVRPKFGHDGGGNAILCGVLDAAREQRRSAGCRPAAARLDTQIAAM